MTHRLLRTDAIRAIEAQGLAATGTGVLMSRAAQALADVCAQHLRRLPAGTPVLALAGPGNNGGDALLAALALHARGWSVQALALSADEPSAPDARRAWRAWRTQRDACWAPDQLEPWLRSLQGRSALVIDGLFGIGLTRGLSGPARQIAESLNARRTLTVIAADVPSGIDGDTGAVIGDAMSIAIRASVTVTFIADKPGLHTGAGLVHAGQVIVADLGLPNDSAWTVHDDRVGSSTETPRSGSPLSQGLCIDTALAQALLPTREADSHKGRHGDVLVVRGAPSMQGASILALLGAQAVGAGRLTLGIDQADLPGAAGASLIRSLQPELMTRLLQIDPAPAAEPGASDRDGSQQLALNALGMAHALVAGCGLGRRPAAQRTLDTVLSHPAALVLDADGLNIVAESARGPELIADRAGSGLQTVLTPHPLEAARLLGASTSEIQRDRIGAAAQLAARTHAIVVLKGAGTVIAWPAKDSVTASQPERWLHASWAISTRGGPLLAVAGTGDVLAGVIGGLLAQGVRARDAACLGVWLHGAAADALTEDPAWAGGIGLPASRLPESIRAVINQLAVGRFEASGVGHSDRPAQDHA
jgi:hydroxyethylthiazole kinase-like uncharacterized protein yjeF